MDNRKRWTMIYVLQNGRSKSMFPNSCIFFQVSFFIFYIFIYRWLLTANKLSFYGCRKPPKNGPSKLIYAFAETRRCILKYMEVQPLIPLIIIISRFIIILIPYWTRLLTEIEQT